MTRLLWIVICTLLLGSTIACSGPDGRADGGSVTVNPANDPTATVTTGSAGVAATTPATTGIITPTTQLTPDPEDLTPTPGATPTAPDATAPGATPTPTRPVTTASLDGALLPHNRIISYYGHPNSELMGILGEMPKEQLLAHLRETARGFEEADPDTPVILAFEIIATVAHDFPATNNTYVTWTDDEIIQEWLDFAVANDMILILDLQIGLDTIEHQIESISHWIAHPNVHVALDPEFSMKANETVPRDRIPGTFIGELSGHEINTAIEMIAEIVREHNIPPKVLVVHQFENEMIYHKDVITPVPEVQFVLDMDGFGLEEAKIGNYHHYVRDELIQFGGIKLFFKQDVTLMTPETIVNLDPPPVLVIYQ
jgi:hypothetical protein